MTYEPKFHVAAKTRNGLKATFVKYDDYHWPTPWIFEINGDRAAYSIGGYYGNHLLKEHHLDLVEDWKESNAQASLEGDEIVIRLGFENMKYAVLGYHAVVNSTKPFVVEDGKECEFAKEVCSALNYESENGTTPIHKLFDAAFEKAFEMGVGVEITEEEYEKLIEEWKQNG